jgi:dimethylglycine dehydrogenase
MDKGDFIRTEALQTRQAEGPRRKLVCLHVDSDTTPAHGGASVMRDGKVLGTVTSGD